MIRFFIDFKLGNILSEVKRRPLQCGKVITPEQA